SSPVTGRSASYFVRCGVVLDDVEVRHRIRANSSADGDSNSQPVADLRVGAVDAEQRSSDGTNQCRICFRGTEYVSEHVVSSYLAVLVTDFLNGRTIFLRGRFSTFTRYGANPSFLH